MDQYDPENSREENKFNLDYVRVGSIYVAIWEIPGQGDQEVGQTQHGLILNRNLRVFNRGKGLEYDTRSLKRKIKKLLSVYQTHNS